MAVYKQIVNTQCFPQATIMFCVPLRPQGQVCKGEIGALLSFCFRSTGRSQQPRKSGNGVQQTILQGCFLELSKWHIWLCCYWILILAVFVPVFVFVVQLVAQDGWPLEYVDYNTGCCLQRNQCLFIYVWLKYNLTYICEPHVLPPNKGSPWTRHPSTTGP